MRETGSNGIGVGLTSADSERLVDRGDENLAVADMSGLRGGAYGLHDVVGLLRRHGDLNTDFRQEVHGIFGAAINLRMALLPPIPLDLGDGHTGDADGKEGVPHLLQL